MDNALRVGKVHIIEWLRPGDLKTGMALLDDLEPMAIVSEPPVQVQLHRVSNRDDFIGVLRSLPSDYLTDPRGPILHIETHGSREGLGTSSEDSIQWPELMEELIPLNRATCLNLVVILAACEGFYGVQMQQPDRRAAAFRGLIAPQRTLTSGEVLDGCLAFYRTMFEQRDGNEAVRAMNAATPSGTDTFWLISAEQVFKIVNRGYFESHCNPEALAARVDRMMSKLARRYRLQRGIDPSHGLAAAWRKEATVRLSDHRHLFDRLRREFFFIDECPGNAQRFDVSFEECWPSS